MSLETLFDTASRPLAQPLAPGTPAPPVLLSTDSGPLALGELRGQPVILAFAPPYWNPARAEQLAHFYNTLVGELSASGSSDEDTLNRVGFDGIWCDLSFAGESADVRVPLLHDLDSSGEAARAFGVEGERALFLIDGEGTVRWHYVLSHESLPRPELALAAVRALKADAGAATVLPTEAPTLPSLSTSRRDFVAAAFALALALAAPPLVGEARAAAPPMVDPVNPKRPGSAISSPTVPVTLKINGKEHKMQLEPRVALLDALRENLGMTGTKKGCDHGQCGACTVHRDGERILSCLSLAVMSQGHEITTIEGLAQGDKLHPVQAAFLEHDGYQCGYCTPGQIMSATALLKEGHYKTDAELRDGMSGNLCRCGAYANIITAIKAARDA